MKGLLCGRVSKNDVCPSVRGVCVCVCVCPLFAQNEIRFETAKCLCQNYVAHWISLGRHSKPENLQSQKAFRGDIFNELVLEAQKELEALLWICFTSDEHFSFFW